MCVYLVLLLNIKKTTGTLSPGSELGKLMRLLALDTEARYRKSTFFCIVDFGPCELHTVMTAVEKRA